MRHVQSLGHYVEGAPKNSGKSEEPEAPEKQEGCKAGLWCCGSPLKIKGGNMGNLDLFAGR